MSPPDGSRSAVAAAAIASRPIRSVLRDRRTLPLVIGLLATQVVALVPIPLLIRDILDTSLPDENRGRLVAAGAAAVALTVVSIVATAFLRHRLLRRGEVVLTDLRDQTFAQVQASSIDELDTIGRDHLFALLVHETDRVGQMVLAALTNLVPPALLVGAITVVLAVINWQLLIVAGVFAPLLVLTNTAFNARLRAHHARFVAAHTAFTSGVRRMQHLLPLTRVRSAEQVELAHQHELTRELSHTTVEHAAVRSSYTAVQQTLVVTSAMCTLVVGGLLVIAGNVTIGGLFSFYTGVALLRPALDQIVHALPTVQAGRASLQALAPLLEATHRPPFLGTRQVGFRGHVAVKDVEFSYPGGTTVLAGLGFELAPGRCTVLTGPNGSGKSTLVSLLTGLHRPTGGCIEVEGVSLDDLDIAAYRRRLGVVFQDPVHIDGTVRDNLTYGLGQVSGEALERACTRARLDEVLVRLPRGLDERLGDLGRGLSGGESQRLAIARALVGEPALLILDEPTNHLDVVTLNAVLDAVLGAPDGPAVLVVTHDARVLARADQIVDLPHPDLRARGATAEVTVVRPPAP